MLVSSSEHKECSRYSQEDFDDVFVTNGDMYTLKLLFQWSVAILSNQPLRLTRRMRNAA